MDTTKVYLVKTAFEHDGLSYDEGVKYELTDAVVATLPEGSVEEFVVDTTPDAGAEDTSAEVTDTEAEAKPATPWAGNHTVGRE